MAMFMECLYHAHSFTTRERKRYDLEYVCCTQNAIYGTDGRKLYTGHPKDYPWHRLSQRGTDEKGRVFLSPSSRPKKPKTSEDAYDLSDGKLMGLGTDWMLQTTASYPPLDSILAMYDHPKYFPILVEEWKRLIKLRAQLCNPEASSRKPPKIILIEQAHGQITVKPAFDSALGFVLTAKADQTVFTMKFDLDNWPWKCNPPLEIAMQESTLLLRRGREKMLLLGIKSESDQKSEDECQESA